MGCLNGRRGSTRPGSRQSETSPAASNSGRIAFKTKLARAGWARVYRAIDSRLGREVAIKVAAAHFSGRFEREARAIAALNHPHICTLHDIGPDFLVMELVDGETLAARLERGRLSIADTISFGAQIADALAAAHDKGIVHRDLKPGNLMVVGDSVKVLDFGLAKSANEQSITRSNVILGTPAYMAPEQREGKATDARTDIYALGLVLHEMATGERVTSRRAAAPRRPAGEIRPRHRALPGARAGGSLAVGARRESRTDLVGARSRHFRPSRPSGCAPGPPASPGPSRR